MKKSIKLIIVFISAFVFRLMPFRAPNLEPIMASVMPIGKIYGKMMAFTFPFLSIALFDFVTSGFGIWTVVTAITYGILGFSSYYFFKNRTGWKNYAIYALIATIMYDCLTGLTIGPLFFHQSFMVSLIGQIPFTAMHLLGNVSFAIVLSPLVEKWLVKEEKKVSVIKEVVMVS